MLGGARLPRKQYFTDFVAGRYSFPWVSTVSGFQELIFGS